ncbi:diguanylate cyclase [Gracilibacillus oryzae]|uniref:Diguanylate cyclase n=1 Tax=Gracilibacillus oryzae TaxID=1672701 RepID=A0A7C8KRG1_9BACI|nr:diguanylate cyclase [Gracilibacillus oryzae]KAB8126206.1 diguanylate cyclase [Gracilibacillus oryzae]
MILKDLFSNLAILVAALFLYTQVTNNNPLNQSSALKNKIAVGLLSGIFSNILMQYSLDFNNTLVDLRQIPIILAAYYGGSVPAVIGLLLVIAGRFLIGLSTSSFINFILMTLITISTLIITKFNLSKKIKIIIVLTTSNILVTLSLSYLLQDYEVLLYLIPVYWVISYLAGFISFYVVEYERSSQKLLHRYKVEAATDGLTGLNNVRKFDQIFNKIARQAEHNKETLSLLFIDIDHFKSINDTYGHKEGDKVLMELSNILKNNVHSADIVSRNGGEEFTVILTNCPVENAKQISEKIRQKVERHPFLLTTGEHIHITVSIGVACYNETTSRARQLIHEADEALYKAKQTGRNKVCIAENLLKV